MARPAQQTSGQLMGQDWREDAIDVMPNDFGAWRLKSENHCNEKRIFVKFYHDAGIISQQERHGNKM